MDYKKVERSWGYYIELYRSKDAVFKILKIQPKQKISFQKHQYRHEFWKVIHGTGVLHTSKSDEQFPTTNYKTTRLDKNEVATIRAGKWHQAKNLSETEELIIYETQFAISSFGECSEQDIIHMPQHVPEKWREPQ